MPLDNQEFRRVLGHFAAGVTIITTIGDDGKPYGLTATAFTSVSLDPPLVLVCADQQELSRRFAVSGGDKFTTVSLRQGTTGAPVLADVLGHLECRATDICEG